jgi:acyl-coenzyme A thioesterase PaaI-like protein
VVVLTAPSDADIEPGSTLKFSAQVTGTADTSVAWTVAEAGGGTIDSTGLYTAPATEGTFHVRADSAIASVKSNGTSVVRVKRNASPRPVSVTVSPGTLNLPFGGSAVFAALVTDATNVSVTWSVLEGSSCGSVSSTGTYTAPRSASTCHVVATSAADPTRSGTATVTVTAPAPVVAISISPASATLDACRALVFTATVTNSANTAVTWTVTEAGGGTVTNGIYTAPATAGTYHVVARSVADTTKTVQGTITVGPEKVVSVAVTPGTGTVTANCSLAFAASVTTTCGVFAAQ